jgi:hypothetical protein
MTKVHHTKYKPLYKQYILDRIKDDGWGSALTDRREKIAYIMHRFHNEYGHEIPRQGKPKALAEWLSGCALPIPVYNGDIVDLAIEMGSIDENPSDKVINSVLQNYYHFMSLMIFEMEREL